MHNQTLLELNARLLSINITTSMCTLSSSSQSTSLGDDFIELEQCIELLCEKIIGRNPADLCLAADALFVLQPSTTLKAVLLRLRKRSIDSKKPQTMLNFLRLCQTIALRVDDRSMIDMLKVIVTFSTH